MASTPSPAAGPSLAGRIAAAIALTIAFYVLALVIGVGLIAGPIIGWANGTGNIFLTITAFFLGGSILYAIVPRRSQFVPPGVKLTDATAPDLMRLIREEAEAGDEPMPDDVFVELGVNAAVTQAKGGRRVLVVGLSLVQALTERELRGVIAHEFGHYRGGDLKAGPFIWRTRATIGRTIDQLSDEDGSESWTQRLVRLPFIWYGKAFMRITSAISRREEFAADRCAVERVGRDVHCSALRKVRGQAAAFDAYWQQEVVAVLEAGRRPPIAEGFMRFMADEEVRDSRDAFVEESLKRKTDPYDSHPSLAERIAAVDSLPAGEPDHSPPAVALLADPETLERDVLEDLIGEQAAEFTSVSWDDVGVEVYGARARANAEQFADFLEGATIGTVPETLETVPATAYELVDRDTDQQPYAEHVLTSVLGDAVLATLHAHGWDLHAPPAEPVRAVRGEHAFVPMQTVHALRDGKLTADAWRAQVAGLGVTDLPLGVGARQTATA
ncbi:M48 family metalloprotease [Solirubrobacter phytolaccae]|uniref:M48 family metalloprotease n=1 Tax=Solirubrobacter phytolaccae TaxID=1404360 RepID=A0A9X3NDU9_9ACTN|nr:M48 family metallopeptidase [Solirubrobacter phytolaccae]MDA0184246.1 M48 family metalloprotease [Solirubrobacter phytolaccae]